MGSPQASHTLAHTMANLINFLADIVEHEPAQLYLQQLVHGPGVVIVPMPPRPTGSTGAATADYYAVLQHWLEQVQKQLVAHPQGKLITTLTHLAAADGASEAQPPDAVERARQIMYLEDAAQLLRLYAETLLAADGNALGLSANTAR